MPAQVQFAQESKRRLVAGEVIETMSAMRKKDLLVGPTEDRRTQPGDEIEFVRGIVKARQQ